MRYTGSVEATGSSPVCSINGTLGIQGFRSRSARSSPARRRASRPTTSSGALQEEEVVPHRDGVLLGGSSRGSTWSSSASRRRQRSRAGLLRLGGGGVVEGEGERRRAGRAAHRSWSHLRAVHVHAVHRAARRSHMVGVIVTAEAVTERALTPSSVPVLRGSRPPPPSRHPFDDGAAASANHQWSDQVSRSRSSVRCSWAVAFASIATSE